MSEKRYGVHDCPNGFYYLRDVTDHSVYIHRNYGYLYSPYKEDIELVSTLLNELADKVDEQQATIEKQNELIKLIANACTYSKEHSVKEILRKEIKAIDTVTYDSAGAWHDYVILSEFFKEHYKEHWDNE